MKVIVVSPDGTMLFHGYLLHNQLIFKKMPNVCENTQQIISDSTVKIITNHVIQEFKKLGTQSILYWDGLVDCNIEHLSMFVKSEVQMVISDNFDVEHFRHNSTVYQSFAIMDNSISSFNKMMDVMMLGSSLYYTYRFSIFHPGILYLLMRQNNIQFGNQYNFIYTFSCFVNDNSGRAICDISIDMDYSIIGEWWERAKQPNVRQRDIPGFERILIDNQLEYIIC